MWGRMLSPWGRLLAAGLLTAAIWLILSWPLPRHVTHAIPSASHSAEIRDMVPGDHLQLLYYFWLVEDMLAGGTPWFHNLYEFNTGDDAARRQVNAYYMPFSLVYAAGSALGGRAIGWNLTGLLSLWMMAWVTWIMVRRWGGGDILGAAGATLALSFPYGWAMLFGGSPTGPSMLWPPLVMLGVDLAVRERRARGGVLAGIGILCASWTDTHVYFFTTLFVPVFALLALIMHPGFAWRQPRAYLAVLVALLPAAGFLVLSVVLNSLDARTATFHSRPLEEVALFSPLARDFLIYRHDGAATHVYLGPIIPLAFVLGLPALAWTAWRRRGSEAWRHLAAFTLLLGAVAMILLLALGPHAPAEGLPLRLARRLIPPYAMIRQSPKIFCLLPILFSLALALAAMAWRLPIARAGRTVIAVLALGLVFQTRAHMQVGLSGLDREQPAYAAVAAQAESEGRPPHAIVLPLWAGDSHFASIYEHYVSLYRIRMLNGYHPFVPRDYVTHVFERFAPLNAGIVTTPLLDELMAMGITFIILHENLFPETVSPFPVTQTLDRLREHPRLSLLKQAHDVWAFQIHPAPDPAQGPDPAPALTPTPSRPMAPGPCPVQGVARRWELEHFGGLHTTVHPDPRAGEGAWLRLAPGGRTTGLPAILAPAQTDWQWLVRARGTGQIEMLTLAGDIPIATATVTLATNDWRWIAAPIPADRDPLVSLHAALSLAEGGPVDTDMLLLAGPDWPELAPGESLTLEPRCFFHAGYTPPGTGHVRFRPTRDPRGAVFYGLKMPLPRGRYAARLTLTTDAPAGLHVGWLSARWRDDEIHARVPVWVGADTPVIWDQTENLPVNLVFEYEANADLTLTTLTLTAL